MKQSHHVHYHMLVRRTAIILLCLTALSLPAFYIPMVQATEHTHTPISTSYPLLPDSMTIQDWRAIQPLLTTPSQQAYLKASNTELTDSSRPGDHFGYALAISGDTLVVGAIYEDSAATGVNGDQTNNAALDSGAAYVFVRSGTTWTQQAYLKASNTEAFDGFGQTVAISGDTIVVGADGEDSAATGVNGDQTSNGAFSAGAAYVFVRSGTTWTQQAYLKASNTNAGDGFGLGIAISGDTIVVGACGEASTATGINGDQTNNGAREAGAVYVFVRSGTAWTQQAYLKASNTEASDRLGVSLTISGDTIAVGAYNEDSAATGINGDQVNNAASESGAVYVFVRSGTTWTQQAYLKASNTEANDFFGFPIAISGDTIAVGAHAEDSAATGVNGDQANNNAPYAGAAYVFIRLGTTWTQQAYLKASNTEANDFFGGEITLLGDTIAVGANGEDSAATGVNGDQANNNAPYAGAAYVFVRSGTTWTQQTYLKASNMEANDQFGINISMSEDTIVVAAESEDSVATGVNGDQSNNGATDSGAAYVFVLAQTPSSTSTPAAPSATSTPTATTTVTATQTSSSTATMTASATQTSTPTSITSTNTPTAIETSIPPTMTNTTPTIISTTTNIPVSPTATSTSDVASTATTLPQMINIYLPFVQR